MLTATHLNAVFSNPVEGREADFNRWYDTCHIADCLRGIEGYAAAQRFRLDHSQCAGEPPSWEFLALYELEGGSLPRIFSSVEDFRRAGGYEPPAGRVAEGHSTWVYSGLETPEVAGLAKGDGDAATGVGSDNYLCLCFTNAYNGWYDENMLGQIASRLDGFVAGARYVRSREQRLGVAPPWEFLSVYEFESASVGEFLGRRAFAALGFDHATWVFRPLSARVTRSSAEVPAAAGA